MIKRLLQKGIENRLFKGKAILLFGPRQSGKSTLVDCLLKEFHQSWLYLNGDEADAREILENTTFAKLKALVGADRIVFIEESQRLSILD
jgi:predicted AAA+ superfamily ATPase